MIRIQQEDFSPGEIINELRQPGVGAVVTFSGMVREKSRDGSEVTFVDWDAYDAMALKVFQNIRHDAIRKFDLKDAAIVHRKGQQKPGENLVFIATASPHRREAFEACAYIMDEIKKHAPLWKKEILASGEERWIEG